MRKSIFCLCKNKDAVSARLISAFVFAPRDRTIPLLLKPIYFKILACFCDCKGPFVMDLVGNPEDLFSHGSAHMVKLLFIIVCLFSSKTQSKSA